MKVQESNLAKCTHILEWCHYVKMSGVMKENLPFELLCAEENTIVETSHGGLVDTLIDLSTPQDLKKMEDITDVRQ